jgi:energy-coupling factor transporter ATP-binding protein EcfA2
MQAGLSEGQMVLLKVIISLFFQRGSADDLIILMDEPETHLHPFAVTQMIDNIRAVCPNAQLWIATHSLHVLAHFPDTDIWFIKDGSVRKAGKHSVDVLHSLTGDDAGLEKLSRLLALPAEYTALKFAAECLLPPGVAETAAGDPQTTQIHQILSGLMTGDCPLRLLDIGMGKGRLLNEFAAHHGQDLPKKIDYFGLNVLASAEDTEACRTKLRTSFADADRRYLDSAQKLKETLDPGSIDLAIMCNVLHEIDPAKWLHIFGNGGYLAERMRPDGFLLIVEDELLKVGERAHAFDFLVLTRNEILTLFGGSRGDDAFVTISHPEPRYRDRLKAHLVPARLLANVDRNSVYAAIAELKKHAMDEIDSIKQDAGAHSSAKHYAFWIHQLANATLVLRS